MVEEQMRRIFFWVTIASGAAAAYLMYRRGEPISQIAKQTLSHPIGSLAQEIKQAV
jgi:hypothetical protein